MVKALTKYFPEEGDPKEEFSQDDDDQLLYADKR